MIEPSVPKHFASRVLSLREERPDVRVFRLSVPDEFAFIPGQWVMVNFPGEPKVARAYSMASSPLEKGSIELCLNKVGDFSARMFALAPGDAVELAGPYGKWRYRESEPEAVLISGGTGVTPFRAMARYVLDRKLPNKLNILYSVKTPDDVLYKKDLEAFRAAGIRVHVTVTRSEAKDWTGGVGRLDLATVQREVPGWSSASYYLCGPKSLVEGFTASLQGAGVPRERIHVEKWGDY